MSPGKSRTQRIANAVKSGTGYVPVFATGAAIDSRDFSHEIVEAAMSRIDERDIEYCGVAVGDWMRMYLDIAGAMPFGETGTLGASILDSLRNESRSAT